jgi:hypothetical protein
METTGGSAEKLSVRRSTAGQDGCLWLLINNLSESERGREGERDRK